MELREVIRRRRMVRAYSDEPLDPAVIDLMLEHALHAPSAGFSQGWAFLVLTEPEDRERFWATAFQQRTEAFRWPAVMRAPCIIVPLSHKEAYLDRYAEADKGVTDRGEAWWPAPYWDIDTGMASLLILLTAVDEGLGALFFGIVRDNQEGFRAAFGIPDAYAPIGAITVGHREEDEPSGSLRRGRRGLDEVVHRGRW
jgi:nitroreductase